MDFLTNAGQWILQAAGAVSGIAVAIFFYSLWRWLQLKIAGETAKVDAILDRLLEDEAERLVKWAEQAFPGMAGSDKLRRVLDMLLSLFPDAAEERLRAFVEAAVYRVKVEDAPYVIQPHLDMDELRSDN